MAKNLVIVESPAKAKTINKVLGKDFVVEASLGHVRDLPRKKLGVDPEAGFRVEYEIIPDRENQIKRLKKLAREAQSVYLACDLDREGEAIAWHLAEVLDLPADKTHRVTFNEITKPAIKKAFAHPGQINLAKVNAQQTRRILDRVVGYRLSPLLWKKVMRGLSAGRVQSVAVRMIAEREKEIKAFQQQEYWRVFARLATEQRAAAPAFDAECQQRGDQPLEPKSHEEAAAVLEALRGAEYRVTEVEKKDKLDRPAPPFITSTLQQAAANRLKFATKRTMRVAQQLYEGLEAGPEGQVGLITYMRTDSLNISQEALKETRAFIPEVFGPAYLSEKPGVFKSKKGAQEAHEAIRPSSVRRTPESLRPYLNTEQLKLYTLIWNRFVATQMAPARYAVTKLSIRASEYLLTASGRILLFDGHLKLYKRVEKDADGLVDLPAVEVGQILHARPDDFPPPRSEDDEGSKSPRARQASDESLARANPRATQHLTQPPQRFNEASLVKMLEKEGIGRPSTYATIISTIQDRGYVELKERRFYCTDLGRVVNDKLVLHFPQLLDYAFTSQMEERLDRVEEDTEDWLEVLQTFYRDFAGDLERADREMKSLGEEPEVSAHLCNKCGAPMIYRLNRRGRFLGCSAYPGCRNAVSLDEDGNPQRDETTDFPCDRCGAPMLIKNGRNGRFFACSAYPTCRNTKSIGADNAPVEPPSLNATCEKCGSPMVMRSGSRGSFAACSGYPKCKNTKPVDQEGRVMEPEKTDAKCEECGSPMVIKKGRRGRFLACSAYPKCRQTKPLPKEPAEES